MIIVEPVFYLLDIVIEGCHAVFLTLSACSFRFPSLFSDFVLSLYALVM
jgi:hypothetical protein